MRSLRPLGKCDDPGQMAAVIEEWMRLPWVNRCYFGCARGVDRWDGGTGHASTRLNDSATLTLIINGGARDRFLPEPPEIEQDKG